MQLMARLRQLVSEDHRGSAVTGNVPL
jgi:hypothetical protein